MSDYTMSKLFVEYNGKKVECTKEQLISAAQKGQIFPETKVWIGAHTGMAKQLAWLNFSPQKSKDLYNSAPPSASTAPKVPDPIIAPTQNPALKPSYSETNSGSMADPMQNSFAGQSFPSDLPYNMDYNQDPSQYQGQNQYPAPSQYQGQNQYQNYPQNNFQNSSPGTNQRFSRFCQACGNGIVPTAAICPACGSPVTGSASGAAGINYAPKSRLTYILFGIFFGGLGIHNFYAKRTGIAVTQLLLTVLTLGYGAVVTFPWCLIELFCIKKDGNGVDFD